MSPARAVSERRATRPPAAEMSGDVDETGDSVEVGGHNLRVARLQDRLRSAGSGPGVVVVERAVDLLERREDLLRGAPAWRRSSPRPPRRLRARGARDR